jgi:hypothetical protein
MIGLTREEGEAINSVLEDFYYIKLQKATSSAAQERLAVLAIALQSCKEHNELSSHLEQISVVTEVLYDFLLIETMNQVRGLLYREELRRLAIIRTVFAKILGNAEIHGRERRIGSIYTVPAELVKIGLHQMLEYPDMELLSYARKHNSGMLGVIARFFWHQDYGQRDEEVVH